MLLIMYIFRFIRLTFKEQWQVICKIFGRAATLKVVKILILRNFVFVFDFGCIYNFCGCGLALYISVLYPKFLRKKYSISWILDFLVNFAFLFGLIYCKVLPSKLQCSAM